ncbi:ATP-binding protein [Psychrosphaera sp. 1_MG-2023]|nr:ATP-binding protein [Psychrosphaera sp. 1_MG-2023]MDO6721241.1 ATP-binding protein [Psychrosphaera sp. 1_MG-2023]
MKIQNKLFLILFGFSILLVTSLVTLMQWSLGRGMVEYVNTKEVQALQPLVAQLIVEYKKNDSWSSMTNRHNKFRRLISEQLSDSEFSPRGNRQGNRQDDRSRPSRRPPPPHERDARDAAEGPIAQGGPRQQFDRQPPPPNESKQVHYAILDATGEVVVGQYLSDLDYSKTPMTIDDFVIGQFAVSKRSQLTKGYEVDFVNQQQSYFWIIATFVLTLVALITLPLTRHLVQPLKQIKNGMHGLTQGEYDQQIQLKRKDEFGELSEHFNELALTLSENESARKRWLANISHELRTPVAILRGELEAMLDDVRPLTKFNIVSVNDEVKHLQRLIDDLNLLASADIGGMRYRKERVELNDLIEGEVEKYRGYLADSGIKLVTKVEDKNITLYADQTRLCQLFENIINNCIKYSGATSISLNVSRELEGGKEFVVINFEDNGIGVDEIHLPNLFEHLYRVDNSRNRKTGGSGLGLSICRHIVTGHQGEIFAEKAASGGLSIMIKLPIS